MQQNVQNSKPNFFNILFKISFFLLLTNNINSQNNLVYGIERTDQYINLLQNKKIGLVTNHTSKFYDKKPVHLVDSLLKRGINIVKIFAPEHGFRGDVDNGEKIDNSVDKKTKIPIVSLYGNLRKPSLEDISEIEIMIFDIQDVGARFYTYLSTLHYIMEASAEIGIKVIVFDRPNPNGHYIDGPVLENEAKSFRGMHNVPIVYGMTIGEYALMINGEKWLKDKIVCDLEIIKMLGYDRNKRYRLKEKPSPNLPNEKSINLYPSLCFFEQTPVSVGRGTNLQFQIIGHPDWKGNSFNFKPVPMTGAKYPKHNGVLCHGLKLTDTEYLSKVSIDWLINSYNISNDKENFFGNSFHEIAGNFTLEKQIKLGLSKSEIRKSWETGLNDFKKIREKYLIYP